MLFKKNVHVVIRCYIRETAKPCNNPKCLKTNWFNSISSYNYKYRLSLATLIGWYIWFGVCYFILREATKTAVFSLGKIRQELSLSSVWSDLFVPFVFNLFLSFMRLDMEIVYSQKINNTVYLLRHYPLYPWSLPT